MDSKTEKNAWRQPFRDSFIQPPRCDPYETLAQFGITFDSSMEAVHACALEGQRQKARDAKREQAYRELRDVEKRLLIDFLYYQPDPGAFEPVPSASETPGAPESINEEEVPSIEDSGLLWELLREVWESIPEESER